MADGARIVERREVSHVSVLVGKTHASVVKA
jgi:hypothetical protein